MILPFHTPNVNGVFLHPPDGDLEGRVSCKLLKTITRYYMTTDSILVAVYPDDDGAATPRHAMLVIRDIVVMFPTGHVPVRAPEFYIETQGPTIGACYRFLGAMTAQTTFYHDEVYYELKFDPPLIVSPRTGLPPYDFQEAIRGTFWREVGVAAQVMMHVNGWVLGILDPDLEKVWRVMQTTVDPVILP